MSTPYARTRLGQCDSIEPAVVSSAVPIAFAAFIVAAGALYLRIAVSGRQSLLFLVGVAAGIVLYHAAFGFTAAWRHFITSGRGDGLRAQMLMLAATCCVFLPLLGRGEIFGHTIRGSVSPVGVSVVVGAFLFGVGMQLGGGCASGTLYTVGGGNTRMVITLLAFIAGSVIGTAHMPWWSSQPAIAPVSIISSWGPWTALSVSLVAFAALARVTIVVERTRRRTAAASTRSRRQPAHWMHGPWPLAAGALGLASVNIATLLIAGRPWGITSAFALWGAKTLAAIGVHVEAWPYWSAPAQRAALAAPVAFDVTSVMDLGLVFGAMAAAGLAGRFAPSWRISPASAGTAIAGGLLLGYGARIAYGCNIGAYFSGVASGSLHGWVWLAAAFAGSAATIWCRQRFPDLSTTA